MKIEVKSDFDEIINHVKKYTDHLSYPHSLPKWFLEYRLLSAIKELRRDKGLRDRWIRLVNRRLAELNKNKEAYYSFALCYCCFSDTVIAINQNWKTALHELGNHQCFEKKG